MADKNIVFEIANKSQKYLNVRIIIVCMHINVSHKKFRLINYVLSNHEKFTYLYITYQQMFSLFSFLFVLTTQDYLLNYDIGYTCLNISVLNKDNDN